MQNLTWVEVNTDNLLFNVAQFRRLVNSKVKIFTVIKSNAYGHGIYEVARVLDKDANVDMLAVVSAEEALGLRDKSIKKDILVLSFYNWQEEDYLLSLVNQNIQLVVGNIDQLSALKAIANKVINPIKIHIKVDVGTHRVGFDPSIVLQMVEELNSDKRFTTVGFMSHLADSENTDQAFTEKQIEEFSSLVKSIKQINKDIICHISCSAATMVANNYHFDAIRLGLSLYGLSPSKHSYQQAKKSYPNFNLKPCLSWLSTIIDIRDVKSGDYIGYAQNFRAPYDMTIATIPVGYWDGLSKLLPSVGAKAIIGNKLCSYFGTVCMNLSMLDITGLKNVKRGDNVILIGEKDGLIVSADYLAEKVSTINYEIITRINPTIRRIYI